MIRILVADAHRLFRTGLAKMLSEDQGFRIVAEADTGEQAVDLAREFLPHIALIDVLLSGIGGFEAAQRIVRLGQNVRVVALTACHSNPFPERMLRAGASGYLTKGVDQQELQCALRKVFAGQRYVCAEIAQQLAVSAFSPMDDQPFSRLSAREMQIMLMVVNCAKVSEISEGLHLSPKTVNSHRYRIFDKLGVSSDVELTLLALRYGLMPPESIGRAEFG